MGLSGKNYDIVIYYIVSTFMFHDKKSCRKTTFLSFIVERSVLCASRLVLGSSKYKGLL